MDGWGLAILVLFGILYFVTRQKQQELSKLFLWFSGIGAGIVVGAVWAMSIVNSLLP